MILQRRAFKRLLPLVCCILLLRLYMLREDGNGLEDELEEPRQYPQTRDTLHQDAHSDVFKVDEILTKPALAQHGFSHSRSSNGQPSEDPIFPLPFESRQPSRLPVRYRNSVGDLPLVFEESNEGSRRNTLFTQQAERQPRTSSGSSPLWMRITDDVYTYSSFWDTRSDLPEGPFVRVLGAMRYQRELVKEDAGYKWSGVVKEDMLNVSCLLWYEDQENPQDGVLKAFIFEEGLKTFVGTFFLCYPQLSEGDFFVNTNKSVEAKNNGRNRIPYAVSMAALGTINASHKLIYLSNVKTLNEFSNSNTSAVCVRPLHGPYSDLEGITQFISYYAVALRVSHFYFYDLAVSPEVKRLLKLFTTDNVTIEILPWNVPTSEWSEFWDLGSLTSLNDCVYRSAGRHRYVAIVDLDEFMVPKTPAADLGELYHNVLKPKHGEVGDAALILNAFFCFDFKENTNKNHTSFPMFLHTQREARLWPPKSRSKMILIPEAIVSVGHHMVHHFLRKTSKNRSSPKHVSVLHHYRTCGDLRLGIHGTGSPVLIQETVKDAAIVKFKKAVLGSKIVALYKNFIMHEMIDNF
ncbi:uncharacterized protein [Procambarus clarkii]|uniref:uncharacterized protein n=1 Tax=Procambarus clarkii TaxID=6728 RepID=UPI0037440897